MSGGIAEARARGELNNMRAERDRAREEARRADELRRCEQAERERDESADVDAH